MATDRQQTPFVKQLAANDRPTRDAAVASLRTFLSGRRDLPPLELLKLHKGLFYCVWHSDRPATQAALCTSLASLLSILPSDTILPYARAFYQTISREWTNIDVLRMEKFLLLVRRFLYSSLELMKREGWKGEVVEGMVAIWEEIPLNVEEIRIPNGMRFHVIDVFVDEVERIGLLQKEDEREAQNGEVLEMLIEPLRKLAKSSPTKPVRIKAKEALADERLPGNEKKEEEGAGNEDDRWDGFDD